MITRRSSFGPGLSRFFLGRFDFLERKMNAIDPQADRLSIQARVLRNSSGTLKVRSLAS